MAYELRMRKEIRPGKYGPRLRARFIPVSMADNYRKTAIN